MNTYNENLQPVSNQQAYNTARNNGATHEEAAGALNVTPDAARMLKSRYNKAGNTSENPNSSKPRKPRSVGRQIHSETPETTKAFVRGVAEATVYNAGITATMPIIATPDLQTVRNAAVSLLLISVVIGHAGLVWYDTGQMWGMPGVIGGAVTFAVVLAAVLLASDASKNRTSSNALWFVAMIDAAAFFVHVPTFEKYADIGPIETRAFAFFLCGCSFVALYLFRDSKLD